METADQHRRAVAEASAMGTDPHGEHTRGGPRDTVEDGRPGLVRRVLSQWPVVLFMTVLWAAMWQDFSLHVLLTGAVFSLLVKAAFPLPPVQFPGRFHPWYVLTFTLRFLWDVVRASASVSWVVLRRPTSSLHSVVEVRLRSHDDLIVTLTSHALALVPGSIVVDVDRATATLYLHCLDVSDNAAMDAYRRNALNVEAGIIRAIGSAEDLQLVRRYPDSAPPFADISDYAHHPPHVLPGTGNRTEGDRA